MKAFITATDDDDPSLVEEVEEVLAHVLEVNNDDTSKHEDTTEGEDDGENIRNFATSIIDCAAKH